MSPMLGQHDAALVRRSERSVFMHTSFPLREIMPAARAFNTCRSASGRDTCPARRGRMSEPLVQPRRRDYRGPRARDPSRTTRQRLHDERHAFRAVCARYFAADLGRVVGCSLEMDTSEPRSVAPLRNRLRERRSRGLSCRTFIVGRSTAASSRQLRDDPHIDFRRRRGTFAGSGSTSSAHALIGPLSA